MLTARPASAGHSASHSNVALGPGLVVRERDGLGIASLSVRRGQRAVLAQRLTAAFGIPLPQGPRRAAYSGTALAGIGPGTWLVTRERAANVLSEALIAAVGDAASVTDQSDAYAVLELSGPALRSTLAKLVPINVHPRAFKVGDVAATVLAQMGALLWRLEDGADGQAVIEVAVFRSVAAGLWQALASHSW